MACINLFFYLNSGVHHWPFIIYLSLAELLIALVFLWIPFLSLADLAGLRILPSPASPEGWFRSEKLIYREGMAAQQQMDLIFQLLFTQRCRTKGTSEQKDLGRVASSTLRCFLPHYSSNLDNIGEPMKENKNCIIASSKVFEIFSMFFTYWVIFFFTISFVFSKG